MKLLLAFLQELVRFTISQDALVLSLHAAKAKVNPSKTVLERFAKVIAGEHAKKYYPPGF